MEKNLCIKMRIAIATLGCKVNQSESASMEGMLRNNNYEIVAYADNPDICIVNTCTVTAKSDYQSRQLIRKAARSGAKVIATGCYAQLRPDELSGLDGIGLITGNSAKGQILNYIEKLQTNNKPSIAIDSPNTLLSPQPYYSTKSRAFLKIQDGCNNRCSYCSVPLARGKSRSLSPEDVLVSAGKLSNDGYNEIVLTGIHIGSYGLDIQPKCSLLSIVQMLITSYPHIRFRLSSIEPHEFKEEFLTFIKDGSVCAHLHIPLQSGSDKILKEMNRSYSTTFFKNIIDKIISACPYISIGTDVIVGFPGESEMDFNDTVKFIEHLSLSYLHVFPYSRRPDTSASLLASQVDPHIKHRRVNILLDISTKKKNAYINNKLENILDVIVENKTETHGIYKGISSNYMKVFIKADNLARGHRLKVKVISLTDSGLLSEPL
ncbi:MAG: tRNA (N(6)-L-threonylcarbamoyladenosine(37)-C(2))-methylthiotransferase MtaB [Nitrospirae bacterium]|nr:tRNA (N(6)-L-threonylcarbamoyladenosine(37)-C(2))-methylthiotransferase MtaB [Nitrospirota bacterium]